MPEQEELGLIEAFLNTVDHEAGTDALADPAGLERWLRERDVLGEGRATVKALAAALELREAIRAALGGTGTARLAEATRPYPLRLGDPAIGEAAVVPAGEGVGAAVGSVVADLARSQVLGTWERLKACPAEGCGWAFVDVSKNRSRRWCEMSSCGNQHKVRSYRARRRSAPVHPGD